MFFVTHNNPSNIRLSSSFLEPYYKKGDPFKSLLARSTYLTKYCRDGETWTDTIRRVVEGNVNQAPGVSVREAEQLFHMMWQGKILPSGRGLWTGGVPGIPSEARYNCYYVTLNSTDDWCWTANMLMMGGGVGVGLHELDSMPVVDTQNCKFAIYCSDSHQDLNEVHPEGPQYLNGTTPVFVCPDSREGWVEALRKVLDAAYQGRSLVVDVSDIRPRGTPIRTFGGIACGPGPLADLLRSVWGVIRGARGRRLDTVEALDVTNFIGLCVKSGNVRRSALITLGDPKDRGFRDAKKDFELVKSHRHTSNNSLVFQSPEDIANFDWNSLVEDNIMFGEPGILNLPLIRRTDPGAKGVNPCGEIVLHDREQCLLSEIFPAFISGADDRSKGFRLLTRYTLRQRLIPLQDPKSDRVREKNMRLGVGLGGICDFDWTPEMLSDWYRTVRKEADDYADELRVNRPNAVTTAKPSGTVSLLNGSSPGIHAPHAPYYIRRTRIAKNDPMARAMMDAGVPYEDDVYDKNGYTLVFSFPTKAPHSKVSKETETLRDQFQRQATVQAFWSDNAVSATLNFDPSKDKQELASLLREFVPKLKSTSCLPSAHGYAQAPYETCSEEEYNFRASTIDHNHKLVNGGDIEIDECSNGVCPIR